MTISQREWRIVLFYTAILLAITTAPYLVAWSAQNAEWHFSGFLFGVEDGNSYLGKMLLGARGLWDFSLFYTPEPHDSAPFFFLPYIIAGQIVGRIVQPDAPHITDALISAYHVMRIVADALFVVMLYRFIAAFVMPVETRLVALVFATLGGGLGWLMAFGGGLAPEFYIPEGFSFLILFGLPHLALARAAMLAGWCLLFRAHAAPTHSTAAPSALLAGVCWLIVGLCVPFYIVVIGVLLAAWGLTLWLRTRVFPLAFAIRGMIAIAVSLPLLAYTAVVFLTNPAFSQWSAQNILISPPPLDYLLAYGVLLLPALFGIRWAWSRARHHTRYALLVAWVICVPVLVYLPVNVQRRLAEGVLIPLAILAAVGLRLIARRLTRRRRTARAMRLRLNIAWVVAASLSSLMLLFGAFLAAQNPAHPLFVAADQRAMYQWLNTHTAPDEIALSAVATGNALPAYTHLRTFMGHGPETLDWQTKTAQLEAFYRDELSADERAALLETFNIRYVIYGTHEAALGDLGAWSRDLERIYHADGHAIYRVPAP